MLLDQYPLNGNDSYWLQKIWHEFIGEKPVCEQFSLYELSTWSKRHLKTSQTEEPLWLEQVENWLWQLEMAGSIKPTAANFAGIPCFYRTEHGKEKM